MSEQMPLFIVLGLLGGFTHVFMDSKIWNDLLKFESVKQIIVGGISGGLYWMLYVDHGFPNFIMAFVVGYSGTDFIIKLIDKMTKKELNNVEQ